MKKEKNYWDVDTFWANFQLLRDIREVLLSEDGWREYTEILKEWFGDFPIAEAYFFYWYLQGEGRYLNEEFHCIELDSKEKDIFNVDADVDYALLAFSTDNWRPKVYFISENELAELEKEIELEALEENDEEQ
jgi:hypothetical protein